jgi:long-chain fatty acid transport protein
MLSNPPYSIPTTQYSVENYMEGSQFVYGGQLGVTYKATDYLSAYVGGRFNYSQNRYVGYIRNIKINPNKPQYGLTGDMIPATAIPQLAEIAADKEVDCEQTGWGAAPILGLDLKAGKWNAAVKYEFNTFLTVKNQTKVDNTGKFPDGASIAQDIPALLTVGLEYSILPSLKAAAGYHYFFDKEARMENSKQNELDHGTYEILLGLEWNITKRILVSAGAQRTQYGVTDEYQSDMRFSLSSFSYGVGGAFLLTKDLKVNLAYFFTDYDDYTKKSAHYNGTPFSGEDVFKRTNHVFGLGIDYHF